MTAPLPLGRVVATPGALKLLMEAREHPFSARGATNETIEDVAWEDYGDAGEEQYP